MAKKTSPKKTAASVADELIDERVSSKQCKLAVDALHQYAEKKAADADEKELLGAKEQHVWLTISVKQISSKRRFKPMKMCVIQPLTYSIDSTSLHLIDQSSIQLSTPECHPSV
jgi:hypothetical protein